MSYMGNLGSVPDLNTLSDISVVLPSLNQVLAYDTTTNRWVNKNVSAINVVLDNLADVVVSAPQSGQVVMFNGTTWLNQFPDQVNRPFQFFMSSFN